MRGMFFAALLVSSLGCSSSDFVVAEAESDAGFDTGTIGMDAESDTTVEETSPPDSTAPDTSPADTSTPSDTLVGSDAIVKDIGTVDAPPIGCDTNSDCGPSSFCFKTGCMVKGTCGPIPSGISNYGPVCGCDGVTYWNSFHAATFSVGVQHTGRCTGPDRKTCSAPGACPEFTNSECIFELDAKESCASTTPIGTCWRNPLGKICPADKSGPSVSTCDGVCKTECDAVKAKATFFVVTCTPT